MQYILSNEEFELFRRLIYDSCGISLTLSKKALVKARLTKRLTKVGIDSFKDYYQYVTKTDKTGKELVHLVDSISTNKTDFFREKKHFGIRQHALDGRNGRGTVATQDGYFRFVEIGDGL